MVEAVEDVQRGKSVSTAASEHGVPLRSLYRKLKNRSADKNPDDSEKDRHEDD